MENMKAVRVHNYGGPEVLRFEDGISGFSRDIDRLARVDSGETKQALAGVACR
jgi:hypothetical protein